MHEMSLCESVLQILDASAKEQGFSTVKTVWLEIGVLSCVEPEAMRFSFDVVTRGTLAEGAVLEIERVQATARCLSCLQDVSVNRYGDPCPACGSSDLQISGGDQLRVKELEVV
ncbi:hydrogenase maturation nickel metallochaperone HypA [Pseudomonadota bacterium]